MKTESYQIAMERTTKPGVFLCQNGRYPTEDEARQAAEGIRAKSEPEWRARSFRIYRVTRELVKTVVTD